MIARQRLMRGCHVCGLEDDVSLSIGGPSRREDLP